MKVDRRTHVLHSSTEILKRIFMCAHIILSSQISRNIQGYHSYYFREKREIVVNYPSLLPHKKGLAEDHKFEKNPETFFVLKKVFHKYKEGKG